MSEGCWSDGKAPTTGEERLIAMLAEAPGPAGIWPAGIPAAAKVHLLELGIVEFDLDSGWLLTAKGVHAATALAQAEAAR